MKIKRNITLLTGNQFFTVVADSIFDLAILWYIYQMTSSAFYTSLATALIALTNIFLGPLIGVFVDRFEPKSSMQIGYAFMIFIGLLLSLAFIYWIDFLLVLIYITIIIQNVCMLLVNPALKKLLPRIVGISRIVRVNGYISSSSQAGDLIGQSISGFLIGLIGFVGVMISHSGIYLLASILLMFVVNITSSNVNEDGENIKGHSKPNFFTELKVGYQNLIKNKAILKLVLVAMAVNVTTIAGSLLVVLVTDQYHATAIHFGVMNALSAGTGILIGLFASKLISLAKPNIIFSCILSLTGGSFIGMGLVSNAYLGTVFFMMLSAAGTLMNVLFGSLLITLIEDKFRGRVITLVSALASLLMPGIAVLGGLIADWSNIVYLFIFSGVWCLLWGVYPLFDKDLKMISKIA